MGAAEAVFPRRAPDPAPAPEPEPEPIAEVDEATGPILVPVTAEDLPGDDNAIPFIEIGGPRAKAPAGPVLMPPKATIVPQVPEVAFQLLPEQAAPAPPIPGPDLIAYHRPEHPTSRQYRLLADGIAAQHRPGRPPVLFFTPASTRTAGTATVANLAVTRASDGVGRVLIIEVDRTPGSAAERFGVATLPGLRELLARTVPVGLALHRTAIEGVYVMPAGRIKIGSDEAARLPGLLDQLRGRFEWILVDAPVWGSFPMNDWASVSDGVYLVLRSDEWELPHADMAHEGIARAGGKLRGCITTQEAATEALTHGHGRGNQVVDHVGAPVGVPSRRLRATPIVRRPSDE
ncbi:MAG TPA: hypothetical protein VHR66_30680 [Gemmataceae bacterium]|nr:hypothetical protein [Gemmataceae bacterium]